MEIVFKEGAFSDLIFFRRTGNKSLQRKIDTLLADMKQNPFSGIGKPKPLRGDLSGYWSRRINKEHRIIYTVEEDTITIYSLKGHYEKNI